MSFIGDQNIGVGKTNPSYHLDISGNCYVSNNCFVSNNIGIGTTNPTYNLDVSGNGRFNGSLYSSGVTTMLKQISNQVYSSVSVNVVYQNNRATPMFVLATIVGSNTGYGVNCDSSPNPTTQIFNSYLAGGNGQCFFIVMPYYYYKFTGSVSLAQVYLYY